MAKMTRLRNMTEFEVRQLIKSNNEIDRPAFGEHLTRAFNESWDADLRINRSTWIVRDNHGEISRPSVLSDWPECTIYDALYALAHEVWCRAVRYENLTKLL